MTALANDLIEIMAYYTVPGVTLDLLALDFNLVQKAYRPLTWRRKCEVIRKGLIDATTPDDAWYFSYRIFNVVDYGTSEGSIATGIDCYTYEKNSVVYCRLINGRNNYLFDTHEEIREELNGPWLIKTASLSCEPIELTVCLDERGDIYLLTGCYKKLDMGVQIVDIARTPFNCQCVNVLTRDGSVRRIKPANCIYTLRSGSHWNTVTFNATKLSMSEPYVSNILLPTGASVELLNNGQIRTSTLTSWDHNYTLPGRWCKMLYCNSDDTVILLATDGDVFIYHPDDLGELEKINTGVKQIDTGYGGCIATMI